MFEGISRPYARYFLQSYTVKNHRGTFLISLLLSLPVHLYKCDAQRGSCGLCLKADPLFGCVWCKGENRCTLKQHCPHPENQWLEHNGINSKCTHPRITKVEHAGTAFRTYLQMHVFKHLITAYLSSSRLVSGSHNLLFSLTEYTMACTHLSKVDIIMD